MFDDCPPLLLSTNFGVFLTLLFEMFIPIQVLAESKYLFFYLFRSMPTRAGHADYTLARTMSHLK